MRARFQSSNHDIAEVLTDHAENLVFQGVKPVFAGGLLKEWGNPNRLHLLTDDHLKVMYDLFIRRELIPASDSGWQGLIRVHQKLHGEQGPALPAYLQAAWVTRSGKVHQPIQKGVCANG